MKAIVLLEPRHDPAVAGPFFGHLLGEGWEVTGYRDQNDVPDDVAAEADCIIAGLAPVDASLIKRCPNLKLIQVPGHGFDHVNVADATAAGVPVATVASSGAEAHTVAEWAILTAGAMSRRLVQGHNAMARGEFANMPLIQAGVFELAGKTIGIIGLGRIGREVAKRARGFDMTLTYFDPVRAPADLERDLGIEFRSLDELVAESDVITLHVPATADTIGMIGPRQFELMKAQAILVNTARGSLIDHDSLVEALRGNRIRGAALDVFETEPPSPDDPLFSLPNVTLSPHMGGVTAESLMRILIAATANCNRISGGEDLRDIVGEGTH